MKAYAVSFLVFLIGMIIIPVFALSKTVDEEILFERSPVGSVSSGQAVPEKQFALYDRHTDTVLTMSEKDYLTGTVLGELYADFHAEAFKAQAVAAYTNAVRVQKASRDKSDETLKGADFAVSTDGKSGFLTKAMAQERFGAAFEASWKKASDAVDSVYGRVLTYEGELISAAYHSISSGQTEDAVNVWSNSVKYLSPVASPGDKNVKDFQTTAEFSADEISKLLKAHDSAVVLPEAKGQWFSDIKKTASGTVTSLKAGNKELTGQDVRTLLSLRSACFDVVYKDGTFTFTVVGYGHGVGMSQNGANAMALEGKSFEDILFHYYSGVKIERLDM